MSRMIETYRGVIQPWECDTLGHMNVQYYVARFSDATFQLMHAIAIAPSMARGRMGLAAVRQELQYMKELVAGDAVFAESGIRRLGNKSLTVVHRLVNAETAEECASAEVVAVLLDLETRRARPLPDEVREAAMRLAGEETAA